MLKEEFNNREQDNDQDPETQKLFEDAMPESSEAKAIPSSQDELSADAGDSYASQEDKPRNNEKKLIFLEEKHAEESVNNESFGDGSLDDSENEERSQGKITVGASQLSSEAHNHIKGWGIDADPSNDPTYPIKKRTNEEQLGNTWKRPTKQKQTVEVLVSNERNNMPAVFSSKNPPKGVSGALKRKAFKYSESDLRHWMILMASDKIGVLEGKIDDLRHGHIPNPIAEHGLKAEWKYNRKEFVKRSLVKTAVLGAAVGLLILSRKKKKSLTIMDRLKSVKA